MAEARNTAMAMDRQQWVKTNKARALELCSMALETANELFDSGDLSSYLTLLCRLHCYNYYNLLLLLRQYPNATCLTTFKEWQRLLGDPNKQVLKQDQKGKGIELVAPFTNLQPQGTRSLSWYSIKQFDISQTTITNHPVRKDTYLNGSEHISELVRAIRRVLSDEYHVSISEDDPSDSAYVAGNFGYRHDKIVHCRWDLAPEEQLLWLSESMICISPPERIVGERYAQLFTNMVQHCLLRIWNISDPRLLYLRKEDELVRSVPSELRSVFLDYLQRRVRHLEESVYCKYQEHLLEREEEEAFISEPVIFQTLDFRRKEQS